MFDDGRIISRNPRQHTTFSSRQAHTHTYTHGLTPHVRRSSRLLSFQILLPRCPHPVEPQDLQIAPPRHGFLFAVHRFRHWPPCRHFCIDWRVTFWVGFRRPWAVPL